jgi:Spy/CpxP family protein refolding chaperone
MQHDVRRLLALQIECKLPAGFTERLNARLAEEPDHQPARKELGGPAPMRPLGWSEMASAWRRETRWRTWSLRLLPAAATLALIVAGTQMRVLTPPAAPPSAVPGPALSTEMELPVPQRPNPPPRRRDPKSPTTRVPFDSPVPPPRDAVDSDGDPLGAVGGNVSEVASTSPPAAPTVPAHPVDLSEVTPRLAPELAEELKLSDTQRKQIEAIYDTRQHALQEILESTRKRVELERHQIDAAIEDVLTPEQRIHYRERRASEGSSNRTRPADPLPRARSPMPPRLAFPDRSGPPF